MEEGQYPHLFNNKLLLRALCSGHSQGRKSRCTNTHTHTEHHFPQFVGTNPKHLSLQEPRFHFKAGMGHPKAIKQPQVIHFGGGGCPGNHPFDDPAWLFFPTHCYSSLWKSGWVRGLPPTCFQAVNIHFYTDYTAQTKAADTSKLQSASILFFFSPWQTNKRR